MGDEYLAATVVMCGGDRVVRFYVASHAGEAAQPQPFDEDFLRTLHDGLAYGLPVVVGAGWRVEVEDRAPLRRGMDAQLTDLARCGAEPGETP